MVFNINESAQSSSLCDWQHDYWLPQISTKVSLNLSQLCTQVNLNGLHFSSRTDFLHTQKDLKKVVFYLSMNQLLLFLWGTFIK